MLRTSSMFRLALLTAISAASQPSCSQDGPEVFDRKPATTLVGTADGVRTMFFLEPEGNQNASLDLYDFAATRFREGDQIWFGVYIKNEGSKAIACKVARGNWIDNFSLSIVKKDLLITYNAPPNGELIAFEGALSYTDGELTIEPGEAVIYNSGAHQWPHARERHIVLDPGTYSAIADIRPFCSKEGTTHTVLLDFEIGAE